MRVRKDMTILERRFVPRDTVIIREGEHGAQAYLIQSGSVRVYVGPGDREIELSRLGAGQIVGEMALIFDGPRTASVKTLEDCNVVVISRDQFREKLQGTDPTIRAVVHMLTGRVMDANATVVNKKSKLSDLKESAWMIYQNVMAGLPRHHHRAFQSNVLPELERLIEAVEGFADRYGGADSGPEKS